MLDLVLAYAHHLAVFAVVGLLFSEFVLVRPGISGERLKQIAGLDGAYGAAATIVVLAGVLRVIFGDKGWSYYSVSQAFWIKMALFVLIGLISILPTIAFSRWRKSSQADPAFVPPETEVRSARRYIHIELGLLALLPLMAAAMARGIG